MKRTIGETLCALRLARGLSQKRAAELLRSGGIEVTNQAVSKWETNQTQPNAAQFLALCRLYGVSDVMAEFGCPVPGSPAARLNREGRKKADEYVGLLLASGLYSDTRAENVRGRGRVLPVFALAASAGTGQFLDSDASEPVEADDSVPASADFGVRLAGDSMTPRFADGQIVWVRRQETLESGEIGVFLYRGDAYCKRLVLDGRSARLVSLNPEYADLRVDPGEELRVFGRVVG